MKTWRPDEEDFDIVIDGEWRKASREEPRPHVDAAILAAARTRRPWFATWQPLAAAAAVAGLAFLLVQLLPSERELEQPIRMESQQPAAVPAGQPGGARAQRWRARAKGRRNARVRLQRLEFARTSRRSENSRPRSRPWLRRRNRRKLRHPDRRLLWNRGSHPGSRELHGNWRLAQPRRLQLRNEPPRGPTLPRSLLRPWRCRQPSGRR